MLSRFRALAPLCARGLTAALLVLLLAVSHAASFAALAPATTAAPAARATHIQAAIDVETRAPRPGTGPGTGTAIAVTMRPDQPWHGYWKNGGDAGFGMQIAWTLPRGVTVSDLAYPVPDTLVIAGLMNHVYDQPYALVGQLSLSPDITPGTRLTLVADANWLACTDEVCVPESGQLTIELVAGDGSIAAADRARFDGFRAALPQPISAPAFFARAGDRLRIAIPVPESLALAEPHLFVETVRANEPGAPQRFSRNGNMLIVETEAGADIAALDRIDALLRIAPGRGLLLTATPGDVPAAGTAIVEPAAPDVAAFSLSLFTTALLGAIMGGLLLNVMPCVFPILSIKALALARAGGDAREARSEGLAYTAGAVLTCLALGTVLLLLRAGGEAVGWAFQLQRPESVVLLIVLMGAITANLAGLFDFTTINLGVGRARIEPADATSGSHSRNAFATGALAAFVATPCSGPFLGAALGATLTLPAWAALPIFGGLGLGLALPFLLLALFPALRRRLPKPGAWMERLRRWLAVPMLLTALALVWLLGRQVGTVGWLIGAGVLALTFAFGWWGGRQQRAGQPVSPAIIAMVALIVPASLLLPMGGGTSQTVAGAAGAEQTGQPWSPAAEAAAIASGRPTLVYFTADWCVSCKVNEAAAINREQTQAAFAAHGVRVLVGDWTSADPAITRKLAQHGRNSVPLYLWYPAGASEPEILPQILTPAMLVDRAGAR